MPFLGLGRRLQFVDDSLDLKTIGSRLYEFNRNRISCKSQMSQSRVSTRNGRNGRDPATHDQRQTKTARIATSRSTREVAGQCKMQAKVIEKRRSSSLPQHRTVTLTFFLSLSSLYHPSRHEWRTYQGPTRRI
jgi:hypothetical protein